MIKQEQVPGARKDSYMSTRPVMTCDTPKCKCKIVGNAGTGDEFIKTIGDYKNWSYTADGKHYCACDGCRETAEKKNAKSGGGDDDDEPKGNMMPTLFRTSNGRAGKAA